MNPNHANLLARLPAHSKTAAIRSAIEAALAQHERYAAERLALASSGEHTDVGVDKAMRANLPAAIRSLQTARVPITALKKEIQSKRDALRPADPDKADLVSAIQHMETHTYLRSLEPLKRDTVMLTTTDLRLIEAAVTAPPELSGYTAADRETVDKIEKRYIELKHPGEVAELQVLESLSAEAEAITLIARNGLRDVAKLEPGPFEAEAAKIERAVWIVGNAGAEQVCEVDANGTASYRPATADEKVSGVRYADINSYRAARAA